MTEAVPEHVYVCGDPGEVHELLISCSWMENAAATLWLPVVGKIESLMEFSLHLWSNQCTNGT